MKTMNHEEYIRTHNVRPGDAIIVKKNLIGLVDHYLIYLGIHYGEHRFIANYTRGTRILSKSELDNFSQRYSPIRIRRFTGNEIQRNAAINRALNKSDEDSYHLILNNCEHYANYVQYNKPYSAQVNLFGAGVAVTGLAMAASSKSNTGKGVGLAMAVLGLITLISNEND
jgi:hypothetical protein